MCDERIEKVMKVKPNFEPPEPLPDPSATQTINQYYVQNYNRKQDQRGVRAEPQPQLVPLHEHLPLAKGQDTQRHKELIDNLELS